MSTVTGRNLIHSAIRLLGGLRPGQSTSVEAYEEYLGSLNDLADSWNTERLMIPVITRTATPVVATQAAYELTAGRIEEAGYTSAGGKEYRLRSLLLGEWASIDKTAPGAPAAYYSDSGDPVQTVTLAPIPAEDGELLTYAWTLLTAFADLDTEYTFAAGYARALKYCLASDIAPAVVIHTKIPVSSVLLGQIERIGMQAKASIRSRNATAHVLSCDSAMLRGGSFDILRGDYR